MHRFTCRYPHMCKYRNAFMSTTRDVSMYSPKTCVENVWDVQQLCDRVHCVVCVCIVFCFSFFLVFLFVETRRKKNLCGFIASVIRVRIGRMSAHCPYGLVTTRRSSDTQVRLQESRTQGVCRAIDFTNPNLHNLHIYFAESGFAHFMLPFLLE